MLARSFLVPVALLLAASAVGTSSLAREPVPAPLGGPMDDAYQASGSADEEDSGGGQFGVFHSQCAFDHRASDDPIVHPDHPGVSHSHDFFGAEGISASSTASDLRGGPTTCRDAKDTAGYWVPTLYIDGQPIPVQFSNAYYTAGGKDRASVKAFPPGLQVVAGGTKQTVSWGCRDQGKSVPRVTRNQFFRCQPDWETVAHVKFPDCWDGRSLSSPDSRSHMTYSTNGTCPDEHPVPVPSINLHINYGKDLPGGTPSLASGEPTTMHADFLNSWVQHRLRELIQECIRESRNCGEASTVP